MNKVGDDIITLRRIDQSYKGDESGIKQGS